nr:HGGxSTG domain-containing protein [Lysobacter sp. MMG2]
MLTGINKPQKTKQSELPELPDASRPRARAKESGSADAPHPELANNYARAYDFGPELPRCGGARLADSKAGALSRRAVCGARRRRDGQPCQAKSEPGKCRCKWHGGCSTGPITVEGRERALANLRQNRRD